MKQVFKHFTALYFCIHYHKRSRSRSLQVDVQMWRNDKASDFFGTNNPLVIHCAHQETQLPTESVIKNILDEAHKTKSRHYVRKNNNDSSGSLILYIGYFLILFSCFRRGSSNWTWSARWGYWSCWHPLRAVSQGMSADSNKKLQRAAVRAENKNKKQTLQGTINQSRNNKRTKLS